MERFTNRVMETPDFTQMGLVTHYSKVDKKRDTYSDVFLVDYYTNVIILRGQRNEVVGRFRIKKGDSLNTIQIDDYVKLASSEGCFLTTACVEHLGKSDDCHELTVLRNFRDGYMTENIEMAQDIEIYYHIAPLVVHEINQSDNKDRILDGIYDDLILPCIDYIDQEKYHECYMLYKNYTIELAEKLSVTMIVV